MNSRVQFKLFETAQWDESFIKGLNVTKESTTPQTESNKKFDFFSDKLNDIVSKIQVTYIPETKNFISIQTYQQIVENSIEFAEEKFIRLFFEQRKERREVINNDKKKYMFLMQKSINDIENMIMKAQEDNFAKLGITKEILEKSEMRLMERCLGPHIFLMQTNIRQKIREKLPKKENVGSDYTKEIIKFQIKILNEKQQFFMSILKQIPNTESSQLMPIFLNLMINDLVFEEYSLEDEDYIQNLNDQTAFNDKEIDELLSGIQKAIYKLLVECQFIPQNMPMGMPNMPFY